MDNNNNNNNNRGILPTHSDVRFECRDGKPVKKVRIFLKTRGCRYAKNKECMMCGYFAMSDDSVTDEDMINDSIKEIKRYDFSECSVIAILPPGSFLDDIEFPANVRNRILEEISRIPEIREVIIESRAEFITDERVQDILSRVPGKEVIIALGLESSNDYTRNKCINKSLGWDTYVRAIKTINKYCNSRTYILLKPPFLTELEAVGDAVNSIRDAFSVGTGSAFLEVCNVQEGTPLQSLYEMGRYKPARLWSVIEVLKKFEGMPVFVGSISDHPKPLVEASNCELCSEKIKKELVENYNATLSLSELRDFYCRCKDTWLENKL